MPEWRASVVVPTYNQREALEITLRSFEHQAEAGGAWEVVVVDDGSTDGTDRAVEAYRAPYPLQYLRRPHAGRAAARNAGVERSRGEVVIFCDGDRPVGNRFVREHLRRHQGGERMVVVGGVWELYFSDLRARRDDLLADLPHDLRRHQRLARQPAYTRAVYRMFDADGETRHAAPWIAFFSGNASVGARMLRDAGGFDPGFVEWGFEHFELGYRLHAAGARFVHHPAARNYHLAHRRKEGFYERSIRSSLAYFRAHHPSPAVQLFEEFLYGRISLEEYHARVAGEASMPPRDGPAVFFRQLGGAPAARE
ncbi:MAG TPA: glycosyltransferase [Longimicrobiaceae bacterium]|nr:glycosyltransferase [Longimicrobiaceae bacterium]